MLSRMSVVADDDGGQGIVNSLAGCNLLERGTFCSPGSIWAAGGDIG